MIATPVLHTAPFSQSITFFGAKIKREFCQGSAIDEALFSAAVRIVEDLETNEAGDVVTPIHDALGWKYTRFGQKANRALYAALLVDENGVCWQAKLSNPRSDKDGKQQKYESPKGSGSKAFLPPIPIAIRRKIAELHGVEVPDFGSFWVWLEQHPEIPIIWTEGAKKSLALLSQGYVAISSYGVNASYRLVAGNFRELIPDVARFAQKGRQHCLAFDQDATEKARYRVNAALFQFGRLLDRTGGKVSIASWDGRQGKGVDDLIAGCGVEAWRSAYDSAISFDRWTVQGYSKLTHEPDLKLNQRYLGKLPIPENARLICLKSAKGTGKTESLGSIVDAAHMRGQRVLLISHRTQLCQTLCDRLGVLSVYEFQKKSKDERESASFDIGSHGFGLCIDSLHPGSQAQFNAEHWRDAVVIFDEGEQIIWHVLNSSTCRGDRIAILQELKRLLTYALDSEGQGKVVLSDADLSNVAIDFIRKTADQPELKPWVCLNEWQPNQPWQVISYGSAEHLLLRLDDRIRAGEKVLICCDSQKPKGRHSTYALEQRYQEMFPDKRILRIDSQTLEREDHPAFGCISKLNELLPGYDIILTSPSLETGISLDFRGHIRSVWGLFWGAIPANSARQQLARLREPVERHIWCNKVGLGTIGRGELSVKTLLKSQDRLVKANLKSCHDAAIDQDEINTQFSAVALETWAKMGVSINASMANYRSAVLEGLKTEGHIISEAKLDIDAGEDNAEKQMRQELTERRDSNQERYGKAIADAQDIDKDTAGKLEDKRSKESEAEQLALAKFKLKERYGIEVTPELYLKDCANWGSGLRLHYFATEGKQFLKMHDRGKRDDLVSNAIGWMPDLNKTLVSAQVKALEALGVPSLLNQREFREDDPRLAQLKERAIQYRADIKTTLGIDIKLDNPATEKKGDSAIQVADKLFNKLGFDLVITLKKQGSRGQQKHIYLLVSSWISKSKPDARKPQEREAYADWIEWAIEHGLDDGRSAVFSAWTERHEARQAKAAEQPIQPDPDFVSSSVPVGTLGNKEYIADVSTDYVPTAYVPTEKLETTPIQQEEQRGAPGAIGVGSFVEWGTSLSVWVVESINASIAQIRQITGYGITRSVQIADIHFPVLNPEYAPIAA